MYPYSFQEFIQLKAREFQEKAIYSTLDRAEVKSLFTAYLKLGGIPDYVRFEQADYLKDLYESILYRDVIVRHKINKVQAVKLLFHYLVSNLGKDMSFNQLKNMLKLANAKTVAEYCYYLEMSYLCFFINRYSPSLKTQAHYGKKQYCIDQALAQKIGFRISEDRGRLLENIVFLELKRRGKEIYFHRDKNECDFLVKETSRISQAIQVCTYMDNDVTRKRELAGLTEAMQQYRLAEGLILTEEQEEDLGAIQIIPIWKWLLSRTPI